MLTALLSLIGGLVTNLMPDILKEVRDSRASTREREFLKLTHQFEMERLKAQVDGKIRESESAIIAEEVRATRETLTAIIENQMRPTGNKFIDGYNALIRPVVATGVTLLFFWVAIEYTTAAVGQFGAGKIDMVGLHTAIWGSMVGEAIMAVLAFLFGLRGAGTLRNIAGR